MQLFDLMEKFAGYGFNKSHAAAYALLAYQTAYMKAHHAAAFMAANMSAVMDDTDKLRQFRDDALANGLAMLPPDFNASGYRFEPVDLKTVRYGLAACAAPAGRRSIRSSRRARPGRYTDLFDFCRRVDKRLVNRRCLEALVRAGAFDGINPNRASLLATAGRAIEAAEQAERSASADQPVRRSRCHPQRRPGAGAGASLGPEAATDRGKSGARLLPVRAPVHGLRQGTQPDFPRTPLARIASAGERVWVAGVVASARVQMTRRGRMMVVELDDGSARQEITVFTELFEKHRDKVKEDRLLVIQGKVQRDNFGDGSGFRISAEDLLDLASLRTRFGARLRLAMNGGTDRLQDAKRLQQMLTPYRAAGRDGCAVLVQYESEGVTCEVALGEAWRVRPDEQMLGELAAWLTPEAVQFQYASA
jgi:DNA polymerase-3 subunit alpha